MSFVDGNYKVVQSKALPLSRSKKSGRVFAIHLVIVKQAILSVSKPL